MSYARPCTTGVYACVVRVTPRTPESSAEVEQLLSPKVGGDETGGSDFDSQQDGWDTVANKDAATVVLEAGNVQATVLLSPLTVLRLLVRRTAFWHLTLAKALLLCVAIGSFAWMPTFYVRRERLNIEQVRLTTSQPYCTAYV